MRYLGAMELADTLTLMWQPLGEEDQLFELEFAQVAIGVWMEPEPFLVVVGQRLYGQETLYVVLDEYQDTDVNRFLQRLVRYKDDYHAYIIYIGEGPHADTVRRQEGLSYYPPGSPATLRVLFPSFRSADLIARIVVQKMEEEGAHHHIEHMLSTQVWDERTQMPMVGKDGEPVFKVHFPVDFSNEQTQAGIRQSADASCFALALVLRGLERMVPVVEEEQGREYHGDAITGY